MVATKKNAFIWHIIEQIIVKSWFMEHILKKKQKFSMNRSKYLSQSSIQSFLMWTVGTQFGFFPTSHSRRLEKHKKSKDWIYWSIFFWNSINLRKYLLFSRLVLVWREGGQNVWFRAPHVHSPYFDCHHTECGRLICKKKE